MTARGEATLELAHYYPGWIWHHGAVEHMKSLLLFFDGYVLLLPEEHFNETVAGEESLAVPLREAGLLHNVDPATWLDHDTARTIRAAAEQVIGPHGRPRLRSALTRKHFISPREDPERILQGMISSGSVTRKRPDLGPDMVEMPARVRSAVLLTLALRASERVSEHRIHLVAGRPAQSVSREDYPVLTRAGSTGRLVHKDIVDVGIDLSRVPVDEILGFRREHGKAYRHYARGLREFVAALERADATEQERLLRDRSEEIADSASDLRRARRGWGRPVASLALAGAGAAWTLHQADITGAVIGVLGAATSFTAPERPRSAFTYLFDARGMGRG
ncbi:hypothetical protein ACWGJB_41310 [Streptomyces sp. NPDC054813]